VRDHPRWEGAPWQHGPDAADYDRTNNVEQVVAPVTADGTAQIVISSYRSLQPQSYALVIRATTP